MLYPVEHCAMTALAFRQDAERDSEPTPKQMQAAKEAAERYKKVCAFERGDHQPDGTVYYSDRVGRPGCAPSRDYLMGKFDTLKDAGLSGAISTSGHRHNITDPEMQRRAQEYLLKQPAQWNPEAAEMELRKQQRKADMKALDQQRSIADEERLKFAQEYIIQDPRKPGKVSARKQIIRQAMEAQKKAFWRAEENSKLVSGKAAPWAEAEAKQCKVEFWPSPYAAKP